MVYTLASLFLLFIIYSFIGYLVEIVTVAIESDKFTFSRGFLIGPIIPVFGVGGMLMYLLLYKYENDIVALFIMSMAICTVLEYFTSYIMEKMFNLRWWDYSHKKMNVNGRICLSNAIAFGIGGVIIIKYVNPKIFAFIGSFSDTSLYIISGVLAILFIIDCLISFNIIFGLKNTVSALEKKDSTFRIKREVKRRLGEQSVLTKRLVSAFPDLSKLNKSFRKLNIERLLFGRKRFLFFKKK